jgi:hypothetical protein
VREEDRFGEPLPRGVYGEVRAPCGTPVPDLVRSAYARHGPTVDGDACEVFARAVCVLNAPSPGRADLPGLPITILYDEIWQRHSALRYRFDVDQRDGRLAYLRWLVEFGVAELGIPAAFATPTREGVEGETVGQPGAGNLEAVPPAFVADPGWSGLPASPGMPGTSAALVEWLPVMKVGPAGERNHAGVCAKPGQPGHLVYGPYVKLGAGDYRVRVRWSAGQPSRTFPRFQRVATIEAVSRHGKTYLAQRQLRVEDYVRPEHELLFHVPGRSSPALPVEVRVWTSGAVPLALSSITVERIAAPAKPAMTG